MWRFINYRKLSLLNIYMYVIKTKAQVAQQRRNLDRNTAQGGNDWNFRLVINKIWWGLDAKTGRLPVSVMRVAKRHELWLIGLFISDDAADETGKPSKVWSWAPTRTQSHDRRIAWMTAWPTVSSKMVWTLTEIHLDW